MSLNFNTCIPLCTVPLLILARKARHSLPRTASAQTKANTFLIFIQRKTKTITNNTSHQNFPISCSHVPPSMFTLRTPVQTPIMTHTAVVSCLLCATSQSLTNKIFPPSSRPKTNSSGTNGVSQLPGPAIECDGPRWPEDQTGSRSRRNATA